MPADVEFQPEQRLHAMSWLFAVIAFVRLFIVPLIVAVLFGSREGQPLWLVFVVIPMIIAAVWKQYFYRYGFGPDGLVIREGLFFRNVRQIDYSRIENVDTERGVLHRLLGVAEVKVETSTGGKPEATIQVLGLEAADALRRQIFARRVDDTERREHSHDDEHEHGVEPLVHLSPLEVIKFGLIDNRGMVVVAGLFGLLYEAGMIEVWGHLVRERLDLQLFDAIVGGSRLVQGGVVIAALLAALSIVRLFSVVLALLTLYDFKLTQSGMDLKARYGLLTRISHTLRLSRIQTVHRTETLLHRWFGRVSLRVDLAGGGGGQGERNEQRSQSVRWLAPVIDPVRGDELIATALPDVSFADPPQWRPLAPGARARVFRVSAFFWAVVSVAIALFTRSAYPLALVVVGLPISWLHATMYVRYTGWALRADVLFVRSGWLTRQLAVVPRTRIQTAQWSESPFDRRHAMASVTVDTAGAGSRSDVIRIAYLEREVAAELAHELYLSAAETESRQTERVLV